MVICLLLSDFTTVEKKPRFFVKRGSINLS